MRRVASITQLAGLMDVIKRIQKSVRLTEVANMLTRKVCLP